MAAEPHYIDVDLKKSTHYKTTTVTQNDTDVVFILRVSDDGRSDESVLDNFSTVTLTSQRRDGQSFYVLGEKIPGTNEVRFALGTKELELTGKVSASAQLYSVDGRQSSAKFNYNVEGDLTGDYVPTETEAKLIEIVLMDGPATIAEAEQVTAQTVEALELLETEKTVAFQELDDVKEDNKLTWKPEVATAALRNSAYPNPQNGDTVRITEEARIDRFNGTEWITTDRYNPAAVDQLTVKLAETDEKLNTRIDTIITTPAEGISEQEIIDARKGKISLGGKISDIETKIIEERSIHNPFGKTQVTPVANWEIGALNVSTGAVTANDKRVRSGFIEVSNGEVLISSNINDYQGFYVIKYDANRNLIGNSGGYATRKYDIDFNGYVRMVSAYKDDRVITSANPFLKYIEKRSKKISTGLSEFVFSNGFPLNIWQVGGLGIATGEESGESNRVVSDFLLVKAGTTVKSTLDSAVFSGFYAFLFDLDMNYKGNSGSYVTSLAIENDCYVRLVSRYKDNRSITNLSDFRDKVFLTINNQIAFDFDGDFNTLYYSDTIQDMSSASGSPLSSTTFQNLYDLFDELMTDNPGVITKNLLGYGTASSGAEDATLPIYEYVSHPPTNGRNLRIYAPTILLVGGTHGNEKVSAWGVYEFFKQALNKRDDQVLQSILANTVIKVIPCLNPGGYNANTRTNLNNVDINRNLSHKWIEASGNKGLAPFSEYESKVFKSWLTSNPNAFAFIDYHNTGEHYDWSYLNTPNRKLDVGYSNLMRRLSVYWNHKYNLQGNAAYGWIDNSDIPVTFREAYHAHGIENSAILEIAWDFNGAMNTKETLERSVELLVGYLQVLFKMKRIIV